MPAAVRAYHSGEAKLPLLRQTIAARPGAHVFTFEMRNGGLGKPVGLSWRLKCAGTETVLAQLALHDLVDDWQSKRLIVDIRSNQCPLQELVLFADRNAGNEYEVEIRKVGAQ